MRETNKVGIARVVLRTKQYLAAIRPKDDALVMETMLFADEVIPLDELDLPGPDVDVTEREEKMARSLIDSLTTDFEPSKYRDEYRERVLELIEQKASGQEIVVEDAAEEPPKVVDLMAALEASLAAVKGRQRRQAVRTPSASAASASVEVEVGGRQLKLSNLDKVLYPETGFTKGQVIDYYTRIAPALLPHLHQRALTLKRYPNGVDGQFFYEKNCPKHRPPWVETLSVWSARNKADVNYCLIDELAGLVWVANLASLELHTSLAHARRHPAAHMLVFDLDPGPPATVVECGQVAPLAPRGARRPGPAGVPEDVGVEGAAALRAAEHAGHLRRDQAVRPRRGPAAGAAPPRARSCR